MGDGRVDILAYLPQTPANGIMLKVIYANAHKKLEAGMNLSHGATSTVRRTKPLPNLKWLKRIKNKWISKPYLNPINHLRYL